MNVVMNKLGNNFVCLTDTTYRVASCSSTKEVGSLTSTTEKGMS